MAARLPLILSQPARRDAIASELIENVVAASLLLPKLDANLVADIGSIDVGSTDHLCLQGHTRDVIVASFLDLATAEMNWQRLGLTGQFIDCGQSAGAIRQLASATQSRRVFYIQLRAQTNVSQLLDQCQELVAAQSVQLVSIQLAGGALAISNRATSAPSSARPSLPVITAPTAAAKSPPPLAAEHTFGAHADEDADWTEIDKLVDDLDALDI